MSESGYKGISKDPKNQYTQGFRWRFRASVDGKTKTIKTSVDLNKLIEFADKWKLDNTTTTIWNSSGYKGISKDSHKASKQGFRWRFRYMGKTIKSSVNLDKLIEFADKWKLDNT